LRSKKLSLCCIRSQGPQGPPQCDDVRKGQRDTIWSATQWPSGVCVRVCLEKPSQPQGKGCGMRRRPQSQQCATVVGQSACGIPRARNVLCSAPRRGSATTPPETRCGRRAVLSWPDSGGNYRPMCDGTSVRASVCFCGKGREHGLYSPRSRTHVSAATPRSWSRSRDSASPAMRRSSRRAGNARRCERRTPVDVAIAPGYHHVHS
jgi:hypothetical protein